MAAALLIELKAMKCPLKKNEQVHKTIIMALAEWQAAADTLFNNSSEGFHKSRVG